MAIHLPSPAGPVTRFSTNHCRGRRKESLINGLRGEQFFAGLPEGVCREIHACLREPQFGERLANLRSVWHRIQHEFEGRFDPSAHLQACEDHLEQDWHYGEPLIADAVSRQDFGAAERFIELTLSSLLRWSAEESWRPEKLLVPECRCYRPAEESQAMLQLLDQWEEVAARRGKPERVASLRLQRAVLKSPEDWTAVLEAFQEYQRQPVNPAVAQRLFAEWRQRIADACAQAESRNEHTTDTWTHRLIEAERATFHSHVLVPALQVSEDMERSLRQALALLGEKANGIKVTQARDYLATARPARAPWLATALSRSCRRAPSRPQSGTGNTRHRAATCRLFSLSRRGNAAGAMARRGASGAGALPGAQRSRGVVNRMIAADKRLFMRAKSLVTRSPLALVIEPPPECLRR